MANMKNDFQKVIKAIRDGQTAKSDYPKAMMTSQQAMKRTATVNCGSGMPGRNRRATVIGNAAFVKWCENYGIKSIDFEEVIDAYGGTQTQIRVTY